MYYELHSHFDSVNIHIDIVIGICIIVSMVVIKHT